MMRLLQQRRRTMYALALLLWFIGSVGASRIETGEYVGGRARDDEERIRRNSSALAAMLGEFRTSISDVMFMKTERYLHGGVSYLPHHSESALSAEDLAEDVETHQSELGMPDEDEEHSGVPTIIPPANRDFRGWIGNLHREVRPWRDPSRAHIHTDGRNLLPWFRVMTRVDPHYIRGYVSGAFWLAYEDRGQAIAFIEEGLENNPYSFELYVSRGLLRLRDARDAQSLSGDVVPTARTYWMQARDDFRRGAELALAQRPDDVDEAGFGSRGWGRYHENDALTACRMDMLITQQLVGDEAMHARRLIYKETFPELELFLTD